MFIRSSEEVVAERSTRQGRENLLTFGIEYLDDCLLGIKRDDLVVIGAPSGQGKTQFCVNLALANLEQGKRVHFFALEAAASEIERRMKWQVLTTNFYGDPNRPKLGRPLLYDEWEIGEYEGILDQYEDWATEYCKTAFEGMFTFYKHEAFDVAKMTESILLVADETDLIILDHVHYFDWDSDNDNRAIKEIAKAARDMCLIGKKPIVLVAHLRKRDKRFKPELCADLEEFHGSSDLTKIATKVITIGAGGPAPDGGMITYFRAPKNRSMGSSSRFLGKVIFDDKRGVYEKNYQIGWANAEKFGEVDPAKRPSWVGRTQRRKARGDCNPGGERGARFVQGREIKNFAPGSDTPSERERMGEDFIP